MSLPPFVARFGRGLSRRREWIWAPLLMMFVAFWLYRTIWFPAAGQKPQWFGWDCIESFWPDLSYYAGALRHGEWPGWNPYDRGGYAFYGDPHPGVYYPVTWLFVIPGAVLGGVPGWVIQVKALLQLAIAGTLLHAYLRTRRLPAPAAALAGVVLIASLPWIIHKASAHCWPMAWAPLIWITTDRLIERAREPGAWRRAAALAGAIGIAGSAGPPPGFFYILQVCFVYGAWRLGLTLWDAHRAGGTRLREEALAQARGLAIAGAATLALLLVVVLPGLSLAADSATRGAARNLTYALNTALAPGPTLTGMISPTAGKMDSYLGLGVLVLAVVALGARPRADRGVPVLFTLLAAFMTVLTFGGATPVLPWLVEHVPGFGLFREPNRYKTMAAMLLAVVAAHGLAALLAEEARLRRRALLVLAGAVVVVGVTLLVLRSNLVKPSGAGAGFGMSFFVLGVGGALLAAVALVPARFRAPLVAAAVGVMYVDVAAFGQPFVRTREAPVDDQEDRRFLAGLEDVTHDWRVYDEFVMAQRPGSRLRVRDFRGYPSGDPFDDARYAEVRARLVRNPELLGAYNVRYVFHGAHHRNGKTKNHIPQAPVNTRPQHFKKIDARRFELLGAAPLVLWYGAATIVDRKRALEHVVMQEATPGGRRVAVVEAADVPAGAKDALARVSAGPVVQSAPAPVPGGLVSYGANRVAVSVDAPAEGLLVLNEKFAPGWRVEVDGRAAEPVRVNYLLRGVVVPAGTHQVIWTYAPPRYSGLVGLWAAGVAFLLVAGGSWLRERRAGAGAEGATTAAAG